MKIAWFTPFNIKSAIGRYSKSAAAALAEYADVDIFAAEWEDLHETDLKIVHYTRDNALSLLKDYDMCVYNIGDNSLFHAPIFDVMRLRKGIVISHDLCAHNFFRGYYIIHRQNPDDYIDGLKHMYGEVNAHKILSAANSPDTWAGLNLVDYHMSELMYPYSLGIAVHSRYHASKLKESYGGPLCVVPLIYESGKGGVSENSGDVDKDKIKLLTVGVVNQNKRIHSTVEAIGSDPHLRKKVSLTCAGSISDEAYGVQLRTQIKNLSLEKNIKLLGFVEEAQLAGCYSDADVIVNLRYPAYEGGSASLVEQLQLGKTVIVSDTGVYAETPDDCVIKINPENEAEELRNTLLGIAKNPTKYAETGEKAKAYAEKTFSRENYGRLLHDFIQAVTFNAPLYALTDLLGQELRAVGVTPDMRICGTLSREVERLFGKLVMERGGD